MELGNDILRVFTVTLLLSVFLSDCVCPYLALNAAPENTRPFLFIPVIQSWIFSIITPDFSVTWSFRNQYADLVLRKHFFLLMLKMVVFINSFVEGI